MKHEHGPSWFGLGLLVAVLAVAYWRLWVGEVFFWGLPALQFVPWRAYGLDAIRAGHLPLWNPYNGGGAPLFANYQSAFLYPLNWLGLLAPSYPALGWLMSVTAVFHLLLGGVGMWMFTGRRGLTALGRGVAALAYALTAYTVARLGTYPIVTVVAWVPFLLWAVDGAATRGNRRDYGLLAGVTALVLLGGHAQTAWYGLLLAGAYLLWRLLRDSPRGPWRLLPAAAAVLLGAGMAGLQLLATADLTINSQRASGYGEQALRYSYGPARTVTLLSPNLFGNPGDGSYLGRGLFYEYGTYVGLITVVAAGVAVLAWVTGRGQRANPHLRDVPFWLGVLVIGFVFALGNRTPVFPFLYDTVPTFNMFQAPVRWHLWTVLALAVLGGVGVGSWGAGPRVVFGTRLVTAGAFGGAVLAWASPRLLPPDLLAIEGVLTLIQALGMTLLWVGLAGVLTLLHAPNLPGRFQPVPGWWRGFWALGVLVVLAVDLGWATRGLNPTVPAAFYAPLAADDAPLVRRGYWPQATLDLFTFGHVFDADGDLITLEPDELGFTPYMQVSDYRYPVQNWQAYRASRLPNLNVLDREALLNNNEPLQPASYADYIARIPESVPPLPGAGAGVDAVYTVDGVQALADPSARAVLGGGGEVVRVEDGYNRVHITLQGVPEPTRLTLRDAAFPGWQASTEGQALRLQAATGFGRVVEGVPAGDSVITLIYRPWWLLPGSLVSGVSLVVWLGLMALRPAPRRT